MDHLRALRAVRAVVLLSPTACRWCVGWLAALVCARVPCLRDTRGQVYFFAGGGRFAGGLPGYV